MVEEVNEYENLEMLSHYIITGYDLLDHKEKGIIQLDLSHLGERIQCYFGADGTKMVFQFGEHLDSEVTLSSSLYDWLDLANGRLNPVWGVLTKKLRFKGDTKLFNKLIDRNLMFQIAANTSDSPSPHERNPVKKWSLPKKILIINGSPRGRSGYTFHYLNRFIEGLERGDASLEVIELGKMKVNPCKGCFHCWKNNSGKCIQKDDVNEIYDIYKDADLIIYAFPLYWDTVPGVLKNFIERAFCLEHPFMIRGITKTRHPRRVKKDQSFFIFTVCGFPEKTHFSSVKEYFKSVSHNAHIPFLGGIYRSACMFLRNDPLYFRKYNQVLDSLRFAGESLYRTGKIDKNTLRTIEGKIDSGEFRTHANRFWENVIQREKYFVDSV